MLWMLPTKYEFEKNEGNLNLFFGNYVFISVGS